MGFEFEPLPFEANALEPYIDEATMRIHHGKHHRTYYEKFVQAVENSPLASMSLEQVMGQVSKHSAAVRNNGGGFYNHNLFWKSVSSPSSGGPRLPENALQSAINDEFGSFEEFKATFKKAALERFGSGFVWLIVESADSAPKLRVVSTPNQDNPLMDVAEHRGEPLFCLDVWEHAYYLKYQNRRPDYVDAFWNVADWDYAFRRYMGIIEG